MQLNPLFRRSASQNHPVWDLWQPHSTPKNSAAVPFHTTQQDSKRIPRISPARRASGHGFFQPLLFLSALCDSFGFDNRQWVEFRRKRTARFACGKPEATEPLSLKTNQVRNCLKLCTISEQINMLSFHTVPIAPAQDRPAWSMSLSSQNGDAVLFSIPGTGQESQMEQSHFLCFISPIIYFCFLVSAE